MNYTITPLNIFFLVFAVKAIYQFTTSQNADGLGGTGLVFALAYVAVGLLIDLALQKFISNYKVMMGIDFVLAASLVWWAFAKGIF